MIRRLLLCLLGIAAFGCSDPSELPVTFPASVDSDWLESEHGVIEAWSASHPEYDSAVQILLTSVSVAGLSPNYQVAFYERRGADFVRIDNIYGFGGFTLPELGQHPELDVPAVVAELEATGERTYFFVSGGKIDSFQENEEGWTEVTASTGEAD